MDLRTAAAAFDRGDVADEVGLAESERLRIITQFPIDRWEALSLDRYALGLPYSGEMTYCRLLEFGTPNLGSISGGSALKHMIYHHNSGEWRLAPPLLGLSPEAAWDRLRSQFVAAFDAVDKEDFAALDELEVLMSGQALVTKSLAAYFPTHFMPVYSASHLRHFVEVLGGTPERSAPSWRANRQLRGLVDNDPALIGWSPHEVMRLLYQEFDPRPTKRTIWKIAPGRNARYWNDCLDGGYICVAWDEVGDLTQYTSDVELKNSLDLVPSESPGGNLVKARNLLAFRDLEPGDRVVANRGMSHVLAVGTVSGAYRFDETRTEAQHVVPIDWDTRYDQELAKQQRGWVPTFARVSESLFLEIIRRPALAANQADPELDIEVSEEISRILAALDRKSQVILHGPPGTGKTRLALNTALAASGLAKLINAPDRAQAVAEMRASGSVRLVTFHPSYGYEDFVEGYKPDQHSTASGLTLKLSNGLFHDLCATAEAEPERTFLLIIDEINRGDLPRIFGELITLLEPDKRGIPVELPISKRPFAVPPNIQIIGTMNTADRSVSHLDAAIRRRFAFVYVGPDPEVLSGSIGPLDLSAFFDELNTRIAARLDADHQVGHAYLLRGDEPIATDEELAAAFYHDIVPLVEDYCVGRTELLRNILGSLVDRSTGRPIQVAVGDLAAALATEFTADSNPDDDN